VQRASLWRGLLGMDEAVVEDVQFDSQAGVLVVSVRPRAHAAGRCGRCGRRAPGYDRGPGRRRWRGLDLGTVRVWLEGEASRVDCSAHGPTVQAVPWARHGAGHTLAFDAQVAWLATQCSKTAVTELMRIAWRTVGSIMARVWRAAEAAAPADRWDGLRRIGIDEVSYRRRQRYLLVVTDHDTGRLVWAGDGRSRATLRGFFDQLGPERSALITHASADGADFIEEVVIQRCPNAVLAADPFHVVSWANDALTRVRVDAWQQARAEARAEPAAQPGWAAMWHPVARPARDRARGLKGSRFALWKNPENLTLKQADKLTWIQATEPILHRAYQLKETLRLIFKLPVHQAAVELDRWIGRAQRSRIQAFVELQRRIRRYRERILTAIAYGLNNGLAEAVNTKIRLLTRIAFGYHSAEPLIATAMLSLGPYRPTLAGRA
jgi:transposase